MFDPVLPLVVNASLLDAAVNAARAFGKQLPACKPHGQDIDRGYLHVSAGPQDVCFGDYTANVAFQNEAWRINLTHDLRTNAISTFAPGYGAATWHRNLGSVAISADAMLGADPYHFGPDGLQLHQIEFACAAMAALAVHCGFDTGGISTRSPFAGEPNILTHAEAADRVGSPPQYLAYGPGSTMERWDFLSNAPLPEGEKPSSQMALANGNGLRARIHLYAAALK